MGSEPVSEPNPNHHQQHEHHRSVTTSPENHANAHDEAVTNKQFRYNEEGILYPQSFLPLPTPPSTLNSPPQNDDVLPAFPVAGIGSFLRQRSTNLSAAISKRISSFRQSMEEDEDENENDDVSSRKKKDLEVTEFNLSGLKVVVEQKPGEKFEEEEEREREANFKGRITFFSRSNCRDCTAVRKFFRERGFRFVEINVDVFRERERELVVRTGSASVPQIFFNEKLFGGLVALNSLRNSGDFERRVAEMLAEECPGDAPLPPAYGFDIVVEEDRSDELIRAVRVLRQRLPIQDCLRRMKIVKNCFDGNELVEVLVQHLGCARGEAVEIGKQLARKHFIHHVFGENDFEEGNHLYRFLEHESYIPGCYNFRGATNDSEPKSAVVVSERLTKIMSAILEFYASGDRQHVDYDAIGKSEEFRRYVNMTQDLQRVNLLELSENEKLAFFLNLYNAMVIHAVIRIGLPEGVIDRRCFFIDFQYLVGGHPFNLTNIKNGILRCNRRSPYSLVKPFSTGDKRLEVALVKLNPLLHFGLCNGTKSSPKVRFFSPQRVVDELRGAAREFFENGGVEVDLAKRTVYLTRIFKWFSGDFVQEKDLIKWIMNYLDHRKAGLLTHLLGDDGPVNISYQDFDWSLNSLVVAKPI